MRRRNFFKLLGLAAALPVIPKLKNDTPGISAASFKMQLEKGWMEYKANLDSVTATSGVVDGKNVHFIGFSYQPGLWTPLGHK